jgi:hypothetical protein
MLSLDLSSYSHINVATFWKSCFYCVSNALTNTVFHILYTMNVTYCRYGLLLLLLCHWVFPVASLKVCQNARFIMRVFYLTEYRLINLILLHFHIFTLDFFVPSDWFIFSDFFHFSLFSFVFISIPPLFFNNSFWRVGLYRNPSDGLYCTGILLTGWTVQESFWRAGLYRNPSDGLDCTGILLTGWTVQESFWRTGLYRNPSDGLDCTGILLTGWTVQESFWRTGLHRNPSDGLDCTGILLTGWTVQESFW